MLLLSQAASRLLIQNPGRGLYELPDGQADEGSIRKRLKERFRVLRFSVFTQNLTDDYGSFLILPNLGLFAYFLTSNQVSQQNLFFLSLGLIKDSARGAISSFSSHQALFLIIWSLWRSMPRSKAHAPSLCHPLS